MLILIEMLPHSGALGNAIGSKKQSSREPQTNMGQSAHETSVLSKWDVEVTGFHEPVIDQTKAKGVDQLHAEVGIDCEPETPNVMLEVLVPTNEESGNIPDKQGSDQTEWKDDTKPGTDSIDGRLDLHVPERNVIVSHEPLFDQANAEAVEELPAEVGIDCEPGTTSVMSEVLVPTNEESGNIPDIPGSDQTEENILDKPGSDQTAWTDGPEPGTDSNDGQLDLPVSGSREVLGLPPVHNEATRDSGFQELPCDSDTEWEEAVDCGSGSSKDISVVAPVRADFKKPVNAYDDVEAQMKEMPSGSIPQARVETSVKNEPGDAQDVDANNIRDNNDLPKPDQGNGVDDAGYFHKLKNNGPVPSTAECPPCNTARIVYAVFLSMVVFTAIYFALEDDEEQEGSPTENSTQRLGSG